MFLSFGLWNVLLLPMAIRVLHATEASTASRRASRRSASSSAACSWPARRPPARGHLDGPVTSVMGVFGILTGSRRISNVAIVLVMITGFLNSPIVDRAPGAACRRTSRGRMRGRVFSAFFVTARRRLPDRHGRRRAGRHLPESGPDRRRVARVLVGAGVLRGARRACGARAPSGAARCSCSGRPHPAAARVGVGRAATMLDFDRLARRPARARRLAMTRRAGFLGGATLPRAEPRRGDRQGRRPGRRGVLRPERQGRGGHPGRG